MSDEVDSIEEQPKPANKFLRFCQWLVFGIVVLFVLIQLVLVQFLSSPGAPVMAYWIMMATGATVALLHAVPVFFRLPRKVKWGVYVAIPVYLVSSVMVGGEVTEAYYRTPDGKVVAERIAAEEKRKAEVEVKQREDRALIEEGERVQREVQDYADRMEACFTWGHRLPSLENSVKDALHNPDSFEHVETVAIVPDENRYNVALRFRGENGFGAIRTETIKARVNPDGCVVEDIGETETE